MTEEEFETLIMRSEGETIDFKREHYELVNGTDESKAKFIKDIISFTNTIRKESAFILIGIESKESGKVFLGLNRNVDDAILQDQVKTRVYPIPQFSYRIIKYKGLEYGVIEIPLKRYPEPIASVVKMKGIEPGKIYIRRGSSNSEAVGKEILLIDRWIKSVKLDHDVKKEIDELLKQVNSGTANKLSYYISSALEITNQIPDAELIRFCKGELVGWYPDNVDFDLNEDNLPAHRQSKVMASLYQIKNVSKYGGGHISLRNELQGDDRFKEINFLMQESITEIEATMDKDLGSGGFSTIKRNMGDLFPEKNGSKTEIFMYADIGDYRNVYTRTRTELIRLLIKVKG
jgi:hypothetical protein